MAASRASRLIQSAGQRIARQTECESGTPNKKEDHVAKAKQIIIKVEDKPGTVAASIRSLSEAGVNIVSVLAWNPQGTLQLVTDNPRKAAKALAAANVAFTEAAAEIVELPNKPGALLAYLEKLAKKGVNLRSICATTSKTGRKAVVVWTAES